MSIRNRSWDLVHANAETDHYKAHHEQIEKSGGDQRMDKERAVWNNEKRKADKTDGMNKLDEMDRVEPDGLAGVMKSEACPPEKFKRMSVEQRKHVMEESKSIAANEEMTQLIDRIETDSFQG